MSVYLICFAVSVFLLIISEKMNNNFFKKATEFVAILIPCFLAGMRSDIIGKDISVYLKPIYLLAQKAGSYSEFLNMKFYQLYSFSTIGRDFERGFVLLIYILTKLFSSLQVIYFVIEFLIIVPIYLGIKKYKVLKDKTWIPMLIFYFLFYNQTFNLMRQFIAISITFLGMSSVINEEKNNKIKFAISIIIGYLFHKSAIIMLLILAIYIVLNHEFETKFILKFKDHKINIFKINFILIIIVSFVLLLSNNKISEYLGLFGLEKYSNYISGNITISKYKILKSLPIIILFTLTYNSIKNNIDKKIKFYIICFFLDSVIISQLSSVFVYSNRIGLFMQIFNIIGFSLIFLLENKKFVIIEKSLLFIYLFYYWYFTYVISNWGETIPFIFYT